MNLPNPCALVAACASKFLTTNDIEHRLLEIHYAKDDTHVIVIFESNGRLHGYDEGGTTTLPKNITWGTKISRIAANWAVESKWDYPVIKARWDK